MARTLATFPPLHRLNAQRSPCAGGKKDERWWRVAWCGRPAVAAALLLGVAGCGSARPSGQQAPGQQAPAHGAPSGSAASSQVRSGSNPAVTPSSSAPAAAAPGPVPAGFAATSVTFVSADEAFVLGTAPCAHAPCTAILRTRDRGATWAALPAPPVPVGEPDGGVGWADLGFTTGTNGVVVHAPADSDGNSTQRPGQLFLTSDGGASWTPVSF